LKKLSEAFSRKILNFKRFTLPQFILSLFLTVVIFSTGDVRSYCYAQEDLMRIHFIDVGYGDAIFIQFPDSNTLMIDAGEKPHSSRIIRYLQALNITTIDQAVITHPHKNHFEGFLDILKVIPIARVFVNDDKNSEEGYEELLAAFRDRRIPIEKLSRGMTPNFSESVNIEVLHPAALSSSANGNSIVLLLKHREISILLTADIELAEQTELIELYQKIRQANSIKVPHHGGPLSEAFIQSFTGKNFIISTGPNPWGLPREDDLQRLQGKIYRTDQQGSIILESNGSSVQIKTLGVQRN